MKKVKLSQEDLPEFEQMIDFLQDYFVMCMKKEKSPANLPLEFEKAFGKNINFYLKQKMAYVALLRMQENFIPLEVIEMYLTYLEKMKNLAQQLNLKEPIEYATLFMYLLQKGYISLNGEYNFINSNDFKEYILGLLPIFDNKGVCRHHSKACSDFINYSFNDNDKVGATSMACELRLQDESYKQKINRMFNNFGSTVKKINLSVINSNLFSSSMLFNSPNHMFTLIRDNNHLIGIDCTNIQLVRLINEKNGKGKSIISEKFYDYILDKKNFSTEYMNNGSYEYYMINSLLSNNNFDSSNYDILYITFLATMLKLFDVNDNIFDYFCENTRKLKEEMVHLVNELNIPSPIDLNLWWSDQSFNYRVGFVPQFLSIDYTTKRQLTKK